MNLAKHSFLQNYKALLDHSMSVITMFLIIWWEIIFKKQMYRFYHSYYDVQHIQDRPWSTDVLRWGEAERGDLFRAHLPLYSAIISFSTSQEPWIIMLTLLLGIKMTWMCQKELVRCHKKQSDPKILKAQGHGKIWSQRAGRLYNLITNKQNAKL